MLSYGGYMDVMGLLCKRSMFAFAALLSFTVVSHNLTPSAQAQLLVYSPATVDYSCRSYDSYDPIINGWPVIAGTLKVPESANGYIINSAKLGAAGNVTFAASIHYQKSGASRLLCRVGVSAHNSQTRSAIFSQAGATDSRGGCNLSLPKNVPLAIEFHTGETSSMGACYFTFR